MEARGGHADHRVSLTVEQDRLTNYVAISGKFSFPETMVEHDHRACAGLRILLRQESATHGCMNA